MIRGAPRIETERLVLRQFTPHDLDSLVAMWASPEVVRYIGGVPLTREDTWRRQLAACGQWMFNGFGYWIVEMDGRIVGQAGLADFKREMEPGIEGEPELGYVFDASVHGQGVAYEACSAILAWADATLGAPSYPAIIDARNEPSIRLAEKLGFTKQADATYRGEPIALFRRPRP